MFTKLMDDFYTYQEGNTYLIFELQRDGTVAVHEDYYRTGGGVQYDPNVGASDDELTDICDRAYAILKAA
jgi:hypothetical protein